MKEQSKTENPERLETYGTQDEDKHHEKTTSKQTQTT